MAYIQRDIYSCPLDGGNTVDYPYAESAVLNEANERTEMDVGKIHIIVHSRYSQSATETAVDKVKKLIMQHIFDQKELDKSAENSVNGT